MSDSPGPVTYNPDIFEVRTIEEAKRIVLTAEDATTDERWRVETPYLAESIGAYLKPDASSLIIDYGCGVGRMAKELIARHDCSVVGVDISTSMRQLAPGYVGNARFAACSWNVIDAQIDHGLQVDGVIAIWSLQHSPKVDEDIARIARALKPGGQLYVCNLERAAVPTNHGWVDTGFAIRTLLADAFEEVAIEPVSPEYTSVGIADVAFIGKYRKRSD